MEEIVSIRAQATQWFQTGQVKSFVVFELQDPRPTATCPYAHTVGRVYAALGTDVNDMYNSWCEKTPSRRWDEVILDLGGEGTVVRELNQHLGAFEYDFCLLCGGGLGLSACHQCLRKYRDDRCRMDNPMPLPEKVQRWFEAQGFRWEQDPELARLAEAKKWEQRCLDRRLVLARHAAQHSL